MSRYYKKQRKRFTPLPVVQVLIHFLMGMLYVLVGVFVITDNFTLKIITFLAPPFNLIFAVIALIYGIFRMYRAWIIYKLK